MEGRAPASLWDRATFFGRPRAASSMTISLSTLLPNIRRKILDKVVVLDKGNASVNAPLPLHGNRHQLISIHIQPL
jgi:hypothetical protein